MNDVPWVVLIDGHSGAGKTTLAAEIAAELSAALGVQAQVLHLDLLYPGWEGLREGSHAVATALRTATYTPYNWATKNFSGQPVTLSPKAPLVIEGCGALTPANIAAAKQWGKGRGGVRTIWIECEAAKRKQRALDRDGDAFAPYWEMWAAQERDHYAKYEPWLIADEVVAAVATD